MTTIALPKSICKAIDACLRNFMWGAKNSGKGLHVIILIFNMQAQASWVGWLKETLDFNEHFYTHWDR